MSKKRKNVSEEGVEEVNTETAVSDTETEDTTEDTSEETTAEEAISETLIRNEGTTMATEENGVATANTSYEQVAMARLYNRNDYPVTLNTTDGNQLVLSPRQKTEPLEAHLLIESEFPSGIIKLDF